jgi:hypothetical protein
VDYHFTREKVVRRDIQLKFISTPTQLADIFTKGLTTARFQFLRDKLMIRDLPISLRRDVKDITKSSTSVVKSKSVTPTTEVTLQQTCSKTQAADRD